MEEQWINCGACKTRTNLTDFAVKKGKRCMTCNRCLEKARAYYKSNRCEHGRSPTACKECGGSKMCKHDRYKVQCLECCGANVCEHKRLRPRCIECGGSGICEHKRRRVQCKQCTDPQKVLIMHWMHSSKFGDKRRKQETDITREFCAKIIEESGNKCCY